MREDVLKCNLKFQKLTQDIIDKELTDRPMETDQ